METRKKERPIVRSGGGDIYTAAEEGLVDAEQDQSDRGAHPELLGNEAGSREPSSALVRTFATLYFCRTRNCSSGLGFWLPVVFDLCMAYVLLL